MNESYVKVTPMGGVGEIGALNCMVYETETSAIIVDCGAQFPDDETMGIDLIVPDFGYLNEIRHKLAGVVLTHGHEDHIGGLAFLLQEFDLPVHAAPFTAGICRRKCGEYLKRTPRFHIFNPGDTLKVGEFEIETAFVNHSIIDASALGIKTSQGWLVHLTDWKIDHDSPDGLTTDLKKFSRWGKEGVLALYSDSTNVTERGATLSEKAIAKQLSKICSSHDGRILVTLFASNINRIQSLAIIAKKLGRTLAFVGRSMHENTTLARELGKLNLDGINVVDIEETREMDPSKVMVMLTGSQAEERSALTRIAFNQFKPFQIKQGDLVLFSSKVIPGNEKNIYNLINNLYRLGAKVMYESVHEIHTSGHAHQDELTEAIKRLKPRHFIPIHGTYRHFVLHKELAVKAGVDRENAFILENGQPLIYDGGIAYSDEAVPTGRKFVDGTGVGDVADIVLRDRKQLSDTGIVVCVLMVDRTKGDIVRGPDLISKGFIEAKEGEELLERAKGHLVARLKQLNWHEMTDPLDLQEEVRVTLRQFFKKEKDRKPVVIPVISEV